MTITVPSGFWDKYYEACDFFLDDDHIGRACTVVYPPKRDECVNCLVPVGMSNTNVYRDGGPAPFQFGNCPLCGGAGYKETSYTDTIRLRTYWEPSTWRQIAGNIVSSDADVLIIGYMADIKKIRQATHLILIKDNLEANYRVEIEDVPKPWGFGKDRYFWATCKGA